MDQGFREAFVAVQQRGVLAHDRDPHLALRRAHHVHDLLPAREIRLAFERQAEVAQHLAVQPFLMVADRHGVDRVHVQRRHHRIRPHVAEQRDLAALVAGDLAVAAADQHVGLDADAQQLLHRMLRRLGLQLAGRGDVGQQREVNEHHPLRPELVAQLTDRLQERQALDVAHRAADLDQREIRRPLVAVVQPPGDGILDGIGDVRNHLHRGAQVVAMPLARDHLGIDAPGGGVVRPRGMHAGEALVMAQVEVGLRPVIGHKHLAMLQGAHRAGIDVQVGVKLAQPHGIATRLQQGAKRRGGNTLAEGGDHAAGDEYEPRHGRPP